MYSKVAEQSSPSMQNWPEEGKTGEPLSDSAQATWLKLKDHLSVQSNGKPFEIELRNENDIQMCDLVQATMTMMPDKYFQTSSW